MMPVLDRPIAKTAWLHEVSAHNGAALAPPDTRAPQESGGGNAGAWEPTVQTIVALQRLENDWDGFGAEAPSRSVLESAIGLAYCFHDNGVPPPQRVAPGVSGSVILEWQDADGTY